MKFFLNFLLIISILTQHLVHSQDIENPRSCPPSIQEPDKTICCENLNKQRDDFAACCSYPIMVIYRDDFEACSTECANTGQEGSRCCILECCFKRLGILTDNMTAINPEGLANSFKMSVKNADEWNKIDCVVDHCTNDLAQSPPTNDRDADEYRNYWDCFEKIPMYLYDIVDCSYDFNFVYCPSYPFTTGKCYETYYYVNDCFINGTTICGPLDEDPRSKEIVQDNSNQPGDQGQPNYDYYGQPTDQGQPNYDYYGQPTDQGQPNYDYYGQPNYDNQGDQNDQGQPNYDYYGQPTDQEQPNYDYQGQPSDQEQPNYDYQGQPSDQEQPNYDYQGQQSDQAQPNYDYQEQNGDQAQPNYDYQGQPSDQDQQNYDYQSQPSDQEQPNYDYQSQQSDQAQPNYDYQGQNGDQPQPNYDYQSQYGDQGQPNYDYQSQQNDQAQPNYDYQGQSGDQAQPNYDYQNQQHYDYQR